MAVSLKASFAVHVPVVVSALISAARRRRTLQRTAARGTSPRGLHERRPYSARAVASQPLRPEKVPGCELELHHAQFAVADCLQLAPLRRAAAHAMSVHRGRPEAMSGRLELGYEPIQLRANALDDMRVVTALVLPEQPRRRIPGAVVAIEQPAIVRHIGQQDPGRAAERG